MAQITRKLKDKPKQVVSVAGTSQAGVKLNPTPGYSFVYNTQRDELAKLLPGEEFTCPDTPVQEVSGCDETDVVPSWAVFLHTAGSGGVKIWFTVEDADYFANFNDEAFVASLLSATPPPPANGLVSDAPNAKHCKDVTWDVQIAEIVTVSEEPVFQDANPMDYFIFGGMLFWITFPSSSIITAQAMLDGEPAGRLLSITFP